MIRANKDQNHPPHLYLLKWCTCLRKKQKSKKKPRSSNEMEKKLHPYLFPHTNWVLKKKTKRWEKTINVILLTFSPSSSSRPIHLITAKATNKKKKTPKETSKQQSKKKPRSSISLYIQTEIHTYIHTYTYIHNSYRNAYIHTYINAYIHYWLVGTI